MVVHIFDLVHPLATELLHCLLLVCRSLATWCTPPPHVVPF